MNPVVGVSLCIGALGAGLAYLAWNNQDDEVDETTNEKVNTAEENNDVGEKNAEPEKTVVETVEEPQETESTENKDVELKTIKVSKVSNDVPIEETTKKQSKMKQFLKESYENSKQD